MDVTMNKTITTPCPHCGQDMRLPKGLYLRDLREAAGISQREFGKKFGVSSPYISDIERNRRECPPEIKAAYLELELIKA
jgi:DNA-binding XRE family transcriptional regulator